MPTNREIVFIIKARNEASAVLRRLAAELRALSVTIPGGGGGGLNNLIPILKEISANTREAVDHLDDLRKNLKVVGGEAESTTTRFGNLRTVVGLVAGYFGAQFVRNIVTTTAEFERLRSSLDTVTGSTAAGGAAFEALNSFAADTPYDVQQVTEAFIRLKSLGLDGSREALESYGNTASAMGKTLIQYVEAIADATTGEFERLKEFGIKARQNANSVSFTFRGVTTTVAKNAAEIEAYLRRIGDVEFAGAMDRQAKTLGGALSNLQDATASFADKIGQGGFARAVSDAARFLSQLAGESGGVAEQIGAVLGAAVDIAVGAVRLLIDNFELVQTAAITAGTYFAVLGGQILAQQFVTGVRSAIAAIQLLTSTLAANPLMALALAVGAAVAALYQLRDTTVEVGGRTATIGYIVASVWDTMMGWLKGAIEWLGNLGDIIMEVASAASTWFGKALRWVINLFKDFLNTVIAVWRAVGAGAIAAAKGIWTVFTTTLASLGDRFVAFGDVVAEALSGDFAAAAGRLVSTEFNTGFEEAGQGVLDAVGAQFGVDYVGNFVQGAQDALGSLVDPVLRDAENRRRSRLRQAREDGMTGGEALGDALGGATVRAADAAVSKGTAKAAKEWASKFKSIIENLLPDVKRAQDLAEATKMLGDAAGKTDAELARFGITRDDLNRAQERANYLYGGETTQLGQFKTQLEEQIRLMGISRQERELETQVIQAQNAARADGRTLTEAELAALRERLAYAQQLRQDEDVQTELDKRIAALRFEESLIGKTNSQRERAIALQQVYDQAYADTKSIEKATAAVQQFASAYDQLVLAQKGTNDLGTAFDRSVAQVLDSAETLQAGMDNLVGGAVDRLTQAFSDFAKTGKLDFKSLLSDISGMIAEFAGKQLLQKALGSLYGGAGGGGFDMLGSLFGGTSKKGGGFDGLLSGLFHDGGIVGEATKAAKIVNLNAYRHAKRMHSGGMIGGLAGLKPDEVPIIAQKGERVLSKDEVKAGVGSGGATSFNPKITINLNSQGSQGNGQQTAQQVGAEVYAASMRAYRRNR
ncbi:tape measure protein [Zavarzinia sp. CC-PAN008]|uniref:tape measure protein n=1 Tax=Zavarzinia sp. CC-PAN008 TaxID=3243332 RepID=UPI003F74809C